LYRGGRFCTSTDWRVKINPFEKNKPHQVGINNDSMGKFKIHPFGQEKAILNENGLIIRKKLYLETRRFHQKPSVHKKGLIISFDLFKSSHDFSFLSWFVFSA